MNENEFEVELNESQRLVAEIFMYNGILQLFQFLQDLPVDEDGCIIPREHGEFLAVVDEWIKENYG